MDEFVIRKPCDTVGSTSASCEDHTTGNSTSVGSENHKDDYQPAAAEPTTVIKHVDTAMFN